MGGIEIALGLFVGLLVFAALREQLVGLVELSFRLVSLPGVFVGRAAWASNEALGRVGGAVLNGLNYPNKHVRALSPWVGWAIIGPLANLAIFSLLVAAHFGIDVLR